MPNFVSDGEAARRLTSANRVLVVGCSGAGKTTLALRIAQRFDLDYQSLDRDVIWLPDWQVREKDEQRAITERLVAKDRWVLDGNGPSSLDLRLPRAELVIWLRLPRRTALFGIARRVWRNYGRVRSMMPEGCPEQLPDREFLAYIWTSETRIAPRLFAAFDTHGPNVPIVVIRSWRQAKELLAT